MSRMGHAIRKSNGKERNPDCLEARSAITAGGVGNAAVLQASEFDGAGSGKIAWTAGSELPTPTGTCHVRRLAEKDYQHNSDARPAAAGPGARNASPALRSASGSASLPSLVLQDSGTTLEAEGLPEGSSSRRGSQVSTTADLADFGSSSGHQQQSDPVEQDFENWTDAYSGSPRSTHHLIARQPGAKRSIKTGFGSAYAEQLDCFLQAIGRFDSRLLCQDAKQLWSRLFVTDCRLNQDVSIHPLIREMALELAQILQQRDPWEARLQAVERFGAEHGRLPKVGGAWPREHVLAIWLADVGRSMKRQKLSAARVQRLLNASDLLRTRVSQWLDPDKLFKLRCRELRDFVREHRRLPRRSKGSVHGEFQLSQWLASSLHRSRGDAKRLQLLQKADPMVEAYVASALQRGLNVQRGAWGQQLKKLVKLVAATGRLPQHRKKEERTMSAWLNHQRRCFPGLAMDLQVKLCDSHPCIATYMKKEKPRQAAVPSPAPLLEPSLLRGSCRCDRAVLGGLWEWKNPRACFSSSSR